jgi:hypothetical protein
VAESDKPQRGYVRVPEECRMNLERLAARYDVPVRSLTRIVLCLGLEMLALNEQHTRDALASLVKREGSPPLAAPQPAEAPTR